MDLQEIKGFILVLIATIVVSASSVAAQTTKTECFVRGAQIMSESYDSATRIGQVTLFHPQAGQVIGQAVAPADRFPNPAQAQLMALAGAKTVAYGKLAERLCGVSVQK